MPVEEAKEGGQQPVPFSSLLLNLYSSLQSCVWSAPYSPYENRKHTHTHTPLLSRPHLLIVPLPVSDPMGSIFIQTTKGHKGKKKTGLAPEELSRAEQESED